MNEEAPRADTEIKSNHEMLKSQHKSDLKKSVESIQLKQSALAKSQKSLNLNKTGEGTKSHEALPTQGDNALVQDTQE